MDLRILAAMPAAVLLLLPAFRSRKLSPRMALRAGLNTVSGIGALLLLNAVGGEAAWAPGMGIGQLVTAGILGIPGVGLLYLLRWLI